MLMRVATQSMQTTWVPAQGAAVKFYGSRPYCGPHCYAFLHPIPGCLDQPSFPFIAPDGFPNGTQSPIVLVHVPKVFWWSLVDPITKKPQLDDWMILGRLYHYCIAVSWRYFVGHPLDQLDYTLSRTHGLHGHWGWGMVLNLAIRNNLIIGDRVQ